MKQDLETRKLIAQYISNLPAGREAIGQKFKTGVWVRIDEKLHPCMSHFTCGCNAIVKYTYAQKFGGNDIVSYFVTILDEKNQPINEEGWYHEENLTKIPDDYSI